MFFQVQSELSENKHKTYQMSWNLHKSYRVSLRTATTRKFETSERNLKVFLWFFPGFQTIFKDLPEFNARLNRLNRYNLKSKPIKSPSNLRT